MKKTNSKKDFTKLINSANYSKKINVNLNEFVNKKMINNTDNTNLNSSKYLIKQNYISSVSNMNSISTLGNEKNTRSPNSRNVNYETSTPTTQFSLNNFENKVFTIQNSQGNKLSLYKHTIDLNNNVSNSPNSRILNIYSTFNKSNALLNNTESKGEVNVNMTFNPINQKNLNTKNNLTNFNKDGIKKKVIKSSYNYNNNSNSKSNLLNIDNSKNINKTTFKNSPLIEKVPIHEKPSLFQKIHAIEVNNKNPINLKLNSSSRRVSNNKNKSNITSKKSVNQSMNFSNFKNNFINSTTSLNNKSNQTVLSTIKKNFANLGKKDFNIFQKSKSPLNFNTISNSQMQNFNKYSKFSKEHSDSYQNFTNAYNNTHVTSNTLQTVNTLHTVQSEGDSNHVNKNNKSEFKMNNFQSTIKGNSKENIDNKFDEIINDGMLYNNKSITNKLDYLNEIFIDLCEDIKIENKIKNYFRIINNEYMNLVNDLIIQNQNLEEKLNGKRIQNQNIKIPKEIFNNAVFKSCNFLHSYVNNSNAVEVVKSKSDIKDVKQETKPLKGNNKKINTINSQVLDDLDAIYFYDKIFYDSNTRSNSAAHNVPKLNFKIQYN